MRKLLGSLAAVAMIAGPLAFSPVASAHGTNPTAAACGVLGSVTTDFGSGNGGVGYDFVQAELNCLGVFDAAGPAAAIYDVSADGDTQGLLGGPETCDEGRNNGGGNLEANEVTVPNNPDAPDNLTGTDTAFTRVGLAVVAGGTLEDENGHDVSWNAGMVFVPTDPGQLTGCAGGVPPVMDAALAGVAVVTDDTVPVASQEINAVLDLL